MYTCLTTSYMYAPIYKQNIQHLNMHFFPSFGDFPSFISPSVLTSFPLKRSPHLLFPIVAKKGPKGKFLNKCDPNYICSEPWLLWTAPFQGLNSGWRETFHCSVIPWLVAPCNTGPVWCVWCGWGTTRKPRWRWACQLRMRLMRFVSLCTLISWSEEDLNFKLYCTLIEVVFLFASQPR